MARSSVIFLLVAVPAYAAGIFLIPEVSVESPQPIQFNHSAHSKKNVSCAECHFICEKNRDEDFDIDCEGCEEAEHIFCDEHKKCPDHKLPGFPGASICLKCHDSDLEDLSEMPEAEARKDAKYPLMEYYQTDADEEFEVKKEIPWQRVTKITTSNVFFSHRTHAVLGGIDCKTCHGDVGQLKVPPSRPFLTISMQWCLGCHLHQKETIQETEHKIRPSTDCVSCHR